MLKSSVLCIFISVYCFVFQGPEFENALYSVVKALVFMHCPDAVLGLYLWCKDKVGRKFTWIKASVDCAAGR